MNATEFKFKRHELSVIAEMNQRYHQLFARRWEWSDKACRIAVGVAAVLDVVVAAMAAGTAAASSQAGHVSSTHWTPIVVACIAAFLAIALNVLPLTERSLRHNDLFRQWSDFREEVDSLAFEVSEPVSPPLAERLRQLDGKLHRICGSEPAPNRKILKECQLAAERWRQEPQAC